MCLQIYNFVDTLNAIIFILYIINICDSFILFNL